MGESMNRAYWNVRVSGPPPSGDAVTLDEAAALENAPSVEQREVSLGVRVVDGLDPLTPTALRNGSVVPIVVFGEERSVPAEQVSPHPRFDRHFPAVDLDGMGDVQDKVWDDDAEGSV